MWANWEGKWSFGEERRPRSYDWYRSIAGNSLIDYPCANWVQSVELHPHTQYHHLLQRLRVPKSVLSYFSPTQGPGFLSNLQLRITNTVFQPTFFLLLFSFFGPLQLIHFYSILMKELRDSVFPSICHFLAFHTPHPKIFPLWWSINVRFSSNFQPFCSLGLNWDLSSRQFLAAGSLTCLWQSCMWQG